jgi:hypothetical protein
MALRRISLTIENQTIVKIKVNTKTKAKTTVAGRACPELVEGSARATLAATHLL